MSSPYLDSQVGRNGFDVASAQTDAALLPPVAGYRLRVLALALSGLAAGATTIVFNSKGSSSGTSCSATFSLPTNGNRDLVFSPYGWFETLGGESLTCTTGAGAGVGIQIAWALVRDLSALLTQLGGFLALEDGGTLALEG